MNNGKKKTKDSGGFSKKVGEKESRKLKAQQRNNKNSIWHGFGMFGLIGWSIVVPTLLGALLGIWLDNRFPGDRSYTLAFLIAGLVVGCFNAWHWVSKELKDMQEEQDNKEQQNLNNKTQKNE